MHEMHIEAIAYRIRKKTVPKAVELIGDAIKCKTFLSCFIYDHDEPREFFKRHKLFIYLKFIIKWLIYPEGEHFKIKIRYRLLQYFTWKQIDFEADGNSVFKRIMRKIYEIIANHFNSSLIKVSGLLLSPYVVIERGFWEGGLMNIDITSDARIGRNVVFSGLVSLIGNSNGGVEVGENVRLFTGAVLLCNKVGRNAIIGANSVVTRDVPDNATVSGNPAKVVFINNPSEEKAAES